MTFARIETLGLEAWLAGRRKDLVSKTYRPDPVRRVSIPKADGEGERLLGIPTISRSGGSDRRPGCSLLGRACSPSDNITELSAKGRSLKRRDLSTIHPEQD